MKKELYIFSGLGADERVFQLLDFSEYSPNFIKWIAPLKSETIQNYATRLLSQIKTGNPVLIGLSFGGMMAIEIAKQIETEKLILISSAKTKTEIPSYYRLVGKTGIHKIIPAKLYRTSFLIPHWLFGTSSKFEVQLLSQILKDTDPAFFKWAVDKIVTWSNQTVLENIFHIHGTKDRLLPLKYINCNLTIDNGGHLITLSRAEDLNRILREQL